jgi:hypothetical protein
MQLVARFVILLSLAPLQYLTAFCIASLRHKPNTNLVGIIAICIVHWILRGEYTGSQSSYQKLYKGTIFKLGVLFRFDVLVHIICHFESV